MREKRIQVKPFEMLSILHYSGVQMVNEHGIVEISGMIDSEKMDEYIRTAEKETWVQILVYDENGSESSIFQGILSDFKLRAEGAGCIMKLAIHSGTKLMDYERHFRTFQKAGYSYTDIVKLCNQEYSNADTIFSEEIGKSVPGFLMQRDETDWQFLKRLASIEHTVIIPDSKTKENKYYFGVRKNSLKEELEAENYTVQYESRISAAGKKEQIKSYIVESRSILALGSQTTFKNNKLWVWKIETNWKGNELYHTYYLRAMAAFQVPRQYHTALIGMSVMGKVKAVEGEQVQIEIDDDENKKSGQCWFDFSTIYSSPEGAGWYCMPEIGDTVRLHCPTEDEAAAYAVSAVHEKNGSGIRTNPDHKIWRNKQGKEIRMTPEKILLTNNDGMSIELSDDQGIKIDSAASIKINASDKIEISSNASLEMAASSKIVLKQGATTMELSDGIKLSGAQINMQ